MKRYVLLVSFLLFFGGCATQNSSSSSSSQQSIDQQVGEVTELAANLDVPWSIQKDQETFYVSERPGTIVQIQPDKVVRQPVHLSETLSDGSEAGLLGFLLATDFEQTQEAYAYYTYTSGIETFNKIVKLRLQQNEWQETQVLLDQLPGGNYHDGGRLAFGPDNKLYATVGDAYQLDKVQTLTSLEGTILRLNLDGTIPADNPYETNYIFSYGHRNPQGLAWTTDGTMYASEHGNQANDEINQIDAGKNYGWPVIEGTAKQAEMETPLFTSGDDDTWAPSGMAEWQGNLYVAGLRGSAIYEVNLEKQQMRPFLEGYGRIRDVLIVDDTLYFVTNNLDGRGNGESEDDKLYQMKLETK